MPAENLVAVVGPTAVGKSALAVRLASELNGEVVNADSRQVYRRMDVGTAKPTPTQLAAVPHHLIDVVESDEEFSLALFLRQARAAIDDIQARSRVPVVVGGTGQYVWGLLEGWQVPDTPPDSSLRRKLEAEMAANGLASLMRRLRSLDPEEADRVDPLNPRRVLRALEVAMARPATTDRPPRRTAPSWKATVIGLTLARGDLDRRVDERVDAMMTSGWVAEVRSLLDSGVSPELPSMSSLGYAEIARHLEGGPSLAETTEAIRRKTRRLVRQQYAWFKLSDERIRWFEATAEGLDTAVQDIAAAVGPDPRD